ncbi:hypothetical protein VNI00_014272 [Paramarasmius palmivorus]|uniref:Uncharacterized protein n=1 Tax=Paramarasmius palmivorus TaxID=297713 RepID=A0AAW0BV43_9AGAR
MEFEAQLYARLLYPLGHGYALWCPEPNEALPAEYTREGIRLGDVGLITLDGGFDFLFNICLPADDPINRSRGTPEQFRPLPCDGQVFQNSHFFKPGEPVYSRRATCRQISVGGSATIPAFPIGAGAGIEISFSNNSGAVLMIPTDSARVDILQRRAFREYAQAHAASWYQFANDTLGRDAENGSIYLVTGHDKSTAWENAVFDSSYSSQSCTFMFEPGGIVGGQMKLSQSSILQSSVRHRCSFLHHQSQLRQNQALFIRGFRVSIRQGLSVRFRGGVKVSGTYTSTAKDILGPVPRLSQAGSSFSMSWGAPSGSSRSGDMDTGLTDDDYKAYNSSSMVVDSPNSSDSDRNHDSPSNGSDTTSIGEDDYLPPSQLHHPLIFINNDILKNDPTIDVVVTHDDDWIALLISEDTEMPDDETLARRFYEKYSVFESDGCAVLKLRLLDLYNPPLVEIRSLIRTETIDYTREAISRQFRVPARSPSNDLFSTLDDDDLCLCPDSPLLAEHLEHRLVALTRARLLEDSPPFLSGIDL